MLNRLLSLGQLIVLLVVGVFPFKSLAQSVPISNQVSLSKVFCLSRLSHQINQIITKPELNRSHWGIIIQDLNTGENFYALNEDKYFIPASNVKLFTSVMAWLSLGKDFQIHTSFYAKGFVPNLDSLTVVGRGDPTLTTEQLKTIVQQLKNLGIRQINQLIIDPSYFTTDGIPSTWEWEDIQYSYAPTLSSLTLNDNQVILTLKPQQVGHPLILEWSDEIASQQWTINNNTMTGKSGEENTITLHPQRGTNLLEITGTLGVDDQPDSFGLAILDPNVYFLEVFKDLLSQEDIKVLNDQMTSTQDNLGKEILVIDSPKLSEILNKINQDSDNLYAENIERILLKEVTENSDLQEELTKKTKLVDASGLSRINLVTPSSLVNLLRWVSQQSDYNIYKDSLAIAGTSGTLKDRFLGTPIVGKLWGKTGTLNGVSALSGYLELPDAQPIVFSIIVNHSDQTSATLRQGIDNIILSVSELPKCIVEDIPFQSIK